MYQPPESRLSMFSPRTAKFVETMIREGEEFDYRRWLRRVREDEEKAKQIPAAFSFGESPPSEMGTLTIAPEHLDARVNSGPARAVCRSDHDVNVKNRNNGPRQRLVMVCNAWDDFQECRKRDAVYGYLKAVFALVVDCKGRRRTKRLLRRAFEFAGLPLDKNADPFAAVIRCTSERNFDNKTISKWARALRYAARCKRPRTKLQAFIKKMGGINACAERYTIYLGRGGR
jgi:hypothetical protein